MLNNIHKFTSRLKHIAHQNPEKHEVENDTNEAESPDPYEEESLEHYGNNASCRPSATHSPKKAKLSTLICTLFSHKKESMHEYFEIKAISFSPQEVNSPRMEDYFEVTPIYPHQFTVSTSKKP